MGFAVNSSAIAIVSCVNTEFVLSFSHICLGLPSTNIYETRDYTDFYPKYLGEGDRCASFG